MVTDRTRYFNTGHINVRNQDGTVDDLKLFFKFNYENEMLTQIKDQGILPGIQSPAKETIIFTNTKIKFNIGSVIFDENDSRVGAFVEEELSYKNKMANKYNGRVKNSRVRKLVLS